MREGVFFYCEITSSSENYAAWAEELLPQCGRIISETEKPQLAFFSRNDPRKFGCIIKYAKKKTAKIDKGDFKLNGNEIRFYCPEARMLRKKWFKDWKTEEIGKDVKITYQVGELLNQEIIEKIVGSAKRPAFAAMKNESVKKKLFGQASFDELVSVIERFLMKLWF